MPTSVPPVVGPFTGTTEVIEGSSNNQKWTNFAKKKQEILTRTTQSLHTKWWTRIQKWTQTHSILVVAGTFSSSLNSTKSWWNTLFLGQRTEKPSAQVPAPNNQPELANKWKRRIYHYKPPAHHWNTSKDTLKHPANQSETWIRPKIKIVK